MKTVILALLVLVVVSQGEALTCFCKGNGCQQTCYGSNQVCASIILSAGSHVSYIQGCMDAGQCRTMSAGSPGSTCCNWNFCNR